MLQYILAIISACKTQSIIRKTTVVAFLSVAMLCTACIGPGQSNHNEKSSSEIEAEYKFLIDDESGYSADEVGVFEKLRAMDLLNENQMFDYERKTLQRDYHYTAEDYAKIKGLDETYLYGFYILSNEEDANEMVKALGFENLDDYMIQKGYVDEDGNPSRDEWCKADIVIMRKIMVSEFGKGE